MFNANLFHNFGAAMELQSVQCPECSAVLAIVKSTNSIVKFDSVGSCEKFYGYGPVISYDFLVQPNILSITY